MPETAPKPWSRLLLAATPAAAFLILGVFLHRNIVSEREERAAATRARSLQLQLDNVLLDIEDAETGQRGYIITRNAVYLQPYRAGLARLRADTGTLQALATASGDSVEVADARSLSPLMAVKLKELGVAINLRTNKGLAAAQAAVRSNRGQQAMDQIRAVVAEMRARAEADLAARRGVYERRSQTTYVLLFAGGAISLVVAVLVNLLFVRTQGRLQKYAATVNAQKEDLERAGTELEVQLEESQALQEELETSNEELHKAMEIAERAADDERFLAGVSSSLASAPFDEESAMTAIVRTCVPFLADYASIDIRQADGSTRLVAFPAQRENPTEVGPESRLSVPVRVRDEVAGALTLVMSDSERRIEDRHRDLALAVARRASLALDRAQLFLSASTAARSAAEANQAKSNFLAAMSHELRTPLNAIMGYTELMAMGISGTVTTEQEQQLQRVRQAAQHLLGLVNDVLDLAKIEAGTLRVEHGTGVSGDAVNAALALVRPQADAKGVQLSETCDGATDVLYRGDPHRARQIVTNLLTNAVKFTAAGGRVTVSCEAARHDELAPTLDRARRYVAIRVTDTGVGIHPNDHGRLFLPFVQLHTSTQVPDARERAGTGLGLAISRQLARLMDGDIAVESAPGKGSTFTFFTPLAE